MMLQAPPLCMLCETPMDSTGVHSALFLGPVHGRCSEDARKLWRDDRSVWEHIRAASSAIMELFLKGGGERADTSGLTGFAREHWRNYL